MSCVQHRSLNGRIRACLTTCLFSHHFSLQGNDSIDALRRNRYHTYSSNQHFFEPPPCFLFYNPHVKA